MPYCGSAFLLVRHSHTRHDNKGENSDRLAVLAEHMRMYVYKIEHLVAHFSKFIMSPLYYDIPTLKFEI